MTVLSPRPASTGRRRSLLVLLAASLPFVLGGCQVPAFLGYRGSTVQGHDEFRLYAATFIAAIVVGVFVAALILWAVIRYRRRSEDMPRQFQYHVGLEVTYTIVPIIVVLVLFAFTVIDENRVDAVSASPAAIVNVSAFQWGWEYDYSGTTVVVRGETTTDPDPVGPAGPGSQCQPADWCLGPGLILPAGQTTRINLRSKDVVHGFYVPDFNFSRYAQPGVLNQFDLTPSHSGVFRAQCTQFCGLYHSLMLFHVVAMPPDQFRAWLASQAGSGPLAPRVGPARPTSSISGNSTNSTEAAS